MSTPVIMPQLGESVVEGTVVRWLIAEGQWVTKDESLLEFSTDKIEGELLALASGIVSQILVADGQTVSTGTVLAVIEEQEAGGRSQGSGDRGQRVATPVAERIAAEQGVELAAVHGTGPDGRITRADVEAHLATVAASSVVRPSSPQLGFISPAVGRLAAEHGVDLAQVVGTGDGGRITKKDVAAFIAQQPGTQSSGSRPPEELIPLSPMRRAIAERMTHSLQAAPQVTTVMEADLSRVVVGRERLKAEFAGQGVRLTFTPFFVQAIVAGLRAMPETNSTFRDDALLIHKQIHIGVAVALPDGLIVPVIRDADSLSLLELARAVNDLSERARAGQLTPDDVQGGTFTLTNHGTSGSLLATPIIVPPQAGILGVGAIQKRPVVIGRAPSLLPDADDAIAIRPMAYLSFTFDHRVLDGQGADRFLAAVKGFLENRQA
jgi:2-oxoglutarate dehydrogenase E2 component (dihydrolipoamide succinyltransferase)